MRLTRCVWLFASIPSLGSAPLLSAAEPFQLQLVTLSGAAFPSGSVIHVPPDQCGELQIRLSQPWSREFRIDELELKFDGAYPKFTRLIDSDGYLLNVRTREPLGLLTKESHRIEASSGGRHPVTGHWTILRWDRAFIESVAVGISGDPIQVQLDQPPGGVVLSGPQGQTHFRGQVFGPTDARLSINGQRVSRVPTKPGYQFDQDVSVPRDAKEAIVRAEDSAGDLTILVLPMLSN